MVNIKEISREEVDALIAFGGGENATFVDDGYRPLGAFLLEENGKVIGIDNTTGNAWTEEFDDRAACEKWLKCEEEREPQKGECSMENREIAIAVKVQLSGQDIDDIMCAALEGGITYWCGQAEVVGEYLGEYGHEQISRGGKLIVHDAESDDEWELDLEGLLKGIQMFLERYGSNLLTGGRIDTGDIDGDYADLIVQYALFGELVFG